MREIKDGRTKGRKRNRKRSRNREHFSSFVSHLGDDKPNKICRRIKTRPISRENLKRQRCAITENYCLGNRRKASRMVVLWSMVYVLLLLLLLPTERYNIQMDFICVPLLW